MLVLCEEPTNRAKECCMFAKFTGAKLVSDCCCSNRCCLPLSSKAFQRLQFNSPNNCLSIQEAMQEEKMEDKMVAANTNGVETHSKHSRPIWQLNKHFLIAVHHHSIVRE